ncbi:hypothetical protein [Nocardia sp. NPDC051832]|uniref:hypothetical protein n=1 Tax=Nocardia sp. NPDC051832 TaxID=3155673 RepID=UPI0034237D37
MDLVVLERVRADVALVRFLCTNPGRRMLREAPVAAAELFGTEVLADLRTIFRAVAAAGGWTGMLEGSESPLAIAELSTDEVAITERALRRVRVRPVAAARHGGFDSARRGDTEYLVDYLAALNATRGPAQQAAGSIAGEIAKRIGGRVQQRPEKAPEVACLKAVGKFDGDAARVLDLAAVRIIHHDRAALYQAVDQLLDDARVRVVGYVDRFADAAAITRIGAPVGGLDAWGPKRSAYRDILVICRLSEAYLPRVSAGPLPPLEYFEVQLITEHIAAAIAREHPLHAWRRLVIAEAKRARRPATVRERAFVRACDEWSRQWFQDGVA